MKKIYTYQLILLLITPIAMVAQSGIPFIQNYLHRDYISKDYYASQQNWDIEQDDNGIIYVANTEGILEYDGQNWDLIKLTAGKLLLILEKDALGTIYAAGEQDFGYFTKDKYGLNIFISLLDLIPEEASIGIQGIITTGSEVVFISVEEDKMLRYKNGALNIEPITNEFILQNFHKFEGKALELVERVFNANNERVVFCTEFPDLPDKLIVTENQHFYKTNGIELIPLIHPQWTDLGTSRIYGGIPLNQRMIALSTISNGMIVTDYFGNLIKKIDKKSGLINDEINNFFIDREDGLWLSLNSGISRLEYPAPITTFDYKNGLPGTVTSIVEFDGNLYVGTSTGLYFSSGKSTESFSEFSQLSDIEVWDITPFESVLLVGYNDGVVVFDPGTQKISEINVLPEMEVFRIHPADLISSLVLLGCDKGVGMLRKVNEKWLFEGFVNGIDNEIRTIAETDQGLIWAAYEQVYQIDFISNPALPPKVVKLGEEHGFNDQLAQYCEVYKANNTVLFGSQEGVFFFDESLQKIRPYLKFGQNFTNGKNDVFNITDGHHNDIWLVCNYQIKHLIGGASGKFHLDSIPFVGIPKAEIWAIYAGSGKLIWIGTSDGLILYNAEIPKNYATNYQTIIRTITINEDSVLFSGSISGISPHDQRNLEIVLPNKFGEVIFDYSASSFEKGDELLYSYKLEGLNSDWSSWSKKSRKEFTNLNSGDYVFHVRSKNIYGHLGQPASYSFSVEPKWFQSWWARLLFIAIFLFSVYMLVYSRSKSLIKRQKILQEKIEERTQQLKETQDRLVTQEKLASLGQLTAGIAHEIKNPLNFINNFSELTLEMADELQEQAANNDDPEKLKKKAESLKEYVVKINEHGVRADKIVNSMLGHSRQQSVERVMADVNNLVEESIEIANHGYKSQQNFINVHFDLKLDKTLRKIQLNPQNISRVILNILNNAFYALESKRQMADDSYIPQITVLTYNGKMASDSDQSSITISIKDNGTGIPKDVLKQVFNPFFTTKPAGSGTGLGLSISYDIIVKEHNGTFEINSEEGAFTEFILKLPG